MGLFSFVGDIWNDITGTNQIQDQSQQFSAELAREMAAYSRENYQNRYQWTVSDMQKAGLNPAMMYSSGGSLVGSSPTASGLSAGSAVGGGTAAMGSLLGLLGNLAYGKVSGTFDKLRAETEATQLTSASSARQMDAQADRARAEALLAREDARVYSQLPERFRNFLGMMRLAPGGSTSQLISLGMEALSAIGKETSETVDKHFGQMNAQDVNSAKSFQRRRDAVVPAVKQIERWRPKTRKEWLEFQREREARWKKDAKESVSNFFDRVGSWMTGVSEEQLQQALENRRRRDMMDKKRKQRETMEKKK